MWLGNTYSAIPSVNVRNDRQIPTAGGTQRAKTDPPVLDATDRRDLSIVETSRLDATIANVEQQYHYSGLTVTSPATTVRISPRMSTSNAPSLSIPFAVPEKFPPQPLTRT